MLSKKEAGQTTTDETGTGMGCRRAQDFLPSFLNCLQHENPDVITTALKNLAEFTVLCQGQCAFIFYFFTNVQYWTEDIFAAETK